MMDTLRAVEGRIFDGRYRWDEIEREAALRTPEVLDLVREACLIESYFAIYTARMTTLFADDVDATSVLAIEAFEAYTHFYLLRRYLGAVGYREVTDEDVAALRRRDAGEEYTDEVRELVNFMATEHFAARFFDDLAERAEEPVLRELLGSLGREERTHSAFAADLLRKRIECDPGVRERILHHARNYRHIGSYVLGEVSNASENNLVAVLGFNRLIEELTGERLSDALAAGRGESR